MRATVRFGKGSATMALAPGKRRVYRSRPGTPAGTRAATDSVDGAKCPGSHRGPVAPHCQLELRVVDFAGRRALPVRSRDRPDPPRLAQPAHAWPAGQLA